ncbi:hypothetical protein Leryth_014918 [Lithospermum erythrorhizon]|nr:hypothetical protein Leryth_014918 [Lithospermum erythrorhizon]
MADAFVSFLLENVSQLLADEVNLLGGAEEQVRSLESWLKLTKEFLRKTSRNREHDMVRVVVDQIRDAAQEAEDTIDAYVVHRLKQQRRSRFGKLLHHVVDHGAGLHRVASNVIAIKNRIQDIYENGDQYGIDLNGSVCPESVALIHAQEGC